MRAAGILAAAVIATGCAQMQQRPTVEIRVPFDAAEAERMLQPGLNTIKGNAFLRQRGGTVVTCAGSGVALVPATAYAKHRIAAIYKGSNISSSRVTPVFVPDPPEYTATAKTTRCDSQGNFTFDRLADGDFYLTTGVAWQVGGAVQGGNLVHRVQVSGGETANIVMSGN